MVREVGGVMEGTQECSENPSSSLLLAGWVNVASVILRQWVLGLSIYLVFIKYSFLSLYHLPLYTSVSSPMLIPVIPILSGSQVHVSGRLLVIIELSNSFLLCLAQTLLQERAILMFSDMEQVRENIVLIVSMWPRYCSFGYS